MVSSVASTSSNPLLGSSTTSSNPLLSSSSTTSNPLASATSTTSNPLLVNNYPSASNSSAQQSAGQQVLTSLGGTSINVLGIESSLITAARAPQQKIINTAVQTLYTAKTSMTTLSQGLTSLQTAADALNTVNGLSQLQFSDNDGAVTATAGGSGAAIQGTHQITVYQLAAAQETQSQTFSSATAPVSANPYTIQLQIGNGGNTSGGFQSVNSVPDSSGNPYSITLTPNSGSGVAGGTVQIPANSTVAQIASAINSAAIGITATTQTNASGNTYIALKDASGSTTTFSTTTTSSNLSFTTAYQPIAAAGLSLTQIANSINNLNSGVSAQVVNSGSGANPYSILLSGNTGLNSQFAVSGSGVINFTNSTQQSSVYSAANAVPQADAFQINIASSKQSASVTVNSNSSLTDIVNAMNSVSTTTGVTAQLIKTDQGTYAISTIGPSGANASYGITTSAIAENTSYSFASGNSIPDATGSTYTLSITPAVRSAVAGGTISIPANSSLATIASTINSNTSTTGISANVVSNSDGSSYLSLADSSGNSNTFSVSSSSSGLLFNTGSASPNLGFSGKNVQDAQDASFSVDNIEYSRPKNTAADVLAGVSLTLNAVNTSIGTGVSTLGVSYNTSAISSLISNFVTAFNNYQGFVSSVTGQTSTTNSAAGSLQKYPEVGSDLQLISNLLVSPSSSASNAIKTWADFGVSIQVNGQLQFNQSSFVSAFNASPNDVITALSNNAQSSPSAFSVGGQGLAGDVSVAVQKMLATNGTVQNVNGQITSAMTDEQNQQDALNFYIQNLQSQYDAQFSSLQSILSQFASTSSQLQQTYNPTKSSS